MVSELQSLLSDKIDTLFSLVVAIELLSDLDIQIKRLINNIRANNISFVYSDEYKPLIDYFTRSISDYLGHECNCNGSFKFGIMPYKVDTDEKALIFYPELFGYNASNRDFLLCCVVLLSVILDLIYDE